MGKHGKNLGKTQAKTAQKAKLLKKAKKAAAPPKQAPKPKAAPPPAKKASKKKAVQDMDVDEFLAGDHLDDAAQTLQGPPDDELVDDVLKIEAKEKQREKKRCILPRNLAWVQMSSINFQQNYLAVCKSVLPLDVLSLISQKFCFSMSQPLGLTPLPAGVSIILF